MFSRIPPLGLIGLLALPAGAQDHDTGNLAVNHGVDEDGDTWPDEVDCDDRDASVYPGAPDEPYDGLDSDCQRDDDYDVDQDGYVADEHYGLCTWPNPDQTFGKLPPGDCDDQNAAVNPAVKDRWGNGDDENCDGKDGTRCGSSGQAGLLFLMPGLAWMRRRR